MYKLVSIIWFRMKIILKSKMAIMMLFVLPILFSVIFGGISFGDENEQSAKPNIGIVIEECYECDATSDYLQRNVNYNWAPYQFEAAREAVTEQEIIAAVIIPNDIFERLEKSMPVFDMIVNNKTEAYIPFSNYIDGVANQLHMYLSMLNVVDQTALLKGVLAYVNEVEPIHFAYETISFNTTIETNEPAQTTTISIGFAVMFMMFAIANSASSIHLERKAYAWQRLIITGTSPTVITLGTMIAYFLVGWMQFATVIVFMRFVFNVYWGSIGYLIMFGSLMILTVVAFSMLLVTLFNTKERADTFSIIIVVSTCMLGGVYWPIELVPRFMQIIGMLTPQYWMMKGLGYGLVNETRLSVVWLPTVLLLSVIVVFTLLVIKTLTNEKKLA